MSMGYLIWRLIHLRQKFPIMQLVNELTDELAQTLEEKSRELMDESNEEKVSEVSLVKEHVRIVGGATIKTADWNLTVHSCYAHGSRSTVEFRYYGKEVARELADVVYVFFFDDKKLGEQYVTVSFSQYKLAKNGSLRLDESGKQQLFLLSRFPRFRPKGRFLAGSRDYLFINATSCLGTHVVVDNAGEIVALSSKALSAYFKPGPRKSGRISGSSVPLVELASDRRIVSPSWSEAWWYFDAVVDCRCKCYDRHGSYYLRALPMLESMYSYTNGCHAVDIRSFLRGILLGRWGEPIPLKLRDGKASEKDFDVELISFIHDLVGKSLRSEHINEGTRTIFRSLYESLHERLVKVGFERRPPMGPREGDNQMDNEDFGLSIVLVHLSRAG